MIDTSTPPLPLHAILWQESQTIVAKIFHHPFIQELSTGTLPTPVYNRYVAQDILFLCSYVAAVSIGLKQHSGIDRSRVLLYALLCGALDDLRGRQLALTKRGNVDECFQLLPATAAFGEFLISTAQIGKFDALLAALSPCVKLYSYLGQKFDKSVAGDPNHPYSVFISECTAPLILTIAADCESLLDEFSTDIKSVRTIYRKALELELGFFEANYRGA